MQAIILAAGMGKRLKELTSDCTKCMVKVNGVTMVERMLFQLDKLNLSSIVIVVGYKADKLSAYISSFNIKTPIIYVHNDIYYKTNNIYSLFLARNYLLKEDTLLLESDLIFEDSVLQRIINNPYPNLVLVAKYESWMDGTVVTLDKDSNIKSFLSKKQFNFADIKDYYKTVNIYKFSKEFSNTHYVPFLEAYSKALGDNEYYEQVLKVITLLDESGIKAVNLDDEAWYEIDDLQDLDIAESIFTTSPVDKLTKIQGRYGGYWRYPRLLDFCYLVNPFFPPQKLLDELKANFERLLCDYPSGMKINCLLAAKYFGLRQEQVVVGNGTTELYKSLVSILTGKSGLVISAFDESFYRKYGSEFSVYYPNNRDFAYSAVELTEFFSDKEISNLLLINPDNLSGNCIEKEGLLQIAEWTENKGITLVVDESFVDFADSEESGTLLEEEVLLAHPKLIVVKSISKSFGVPGLRLGVLASHNLELIRFLKKDVAVWNINSFAEFFMQIFEKYKKEYETGLKSFINTRKDYLAKLRKIKGLRVIPSQANYFMCEVLPPYSATETARRLLQDFNILIKDLSTKTGFNKGQYIRVAVKTKEENDLLINALTKVLR